MIYSNFCIAKILKEKIEKILELLNQAIENGDSIYFTGAGRSGDISTAVARRFMQLKRGMRVFCIPSGVAPSFSEGDVLIAISSSGTTKTTKTQVEQAKEKGVIIISVVSEKYSEITELSNIFIVLPQKPSNKEEEIVHLFPLNTFFEILALMFLDSLIPYLMKQLGVTEPEMAKNHPHY